MAAKDVHTCDACGLEAAGYTQTELLDQGWRFHSVRYGRRFVMCCSCELRFAERRKAQDRAR